MSPVKYHIRLWVVQYSTKVAVLDLCVCDAFLQNACMSIIVLSPAECMCMNNLSGVQMELTDTDKNGWTTIALRRYEQ